MKTEDEEKTKSTTKEKVKRKMSIFTIIIWVALVVTMSVIVVQSVNKTNALEEGETRKITVKVDFSEYFEEIDFSMLYEKYGVTEEAYKVDFMSSQYEVATVITNNITEYGDIAGDTIFITNEGNIGVYEIEITNEAKYISYHDVNDNYNNLYKYNIESETNEIEYIKDNIHRNKYYGEKIKEEQDAYEVKLKKRTDLKTITVKVDFSECFEKEGITEETEKEEFMSDRYSISAVKTNNVAEENVFAGNAIFITNEGNIGVYEIEITNEARYIAYHDALGMTYSIESETNEIEYINDNIHGKIYYGEKIKEEQDIYEVRLKYDSRDTYISKIAKWTDKENGIATINLGYNSVALAYASINRRLNKIYIDRLSDEFELSPEYYNDTSWKILDTVDYNNLKEFTVMYSEKKFSLIPTEVYEEFYSSDDNSYKNIKYVYVKDTNTIYWCSDLTDILNNVSINVVYKEYGSLDYNRTLDINKESKFFDFDNHEYMEEIYNIATPNLKYSHTQEGIIKVSKIIDETEEKSTCYVGIFEKEEDNVTDKIYSMEMIDGKGDIIIEIPNYDKNKEYYIYEVDKEGNKISNKKITYSSNKAEFEYIRDSKIESDKNVVSSVMSDRFSEDKTDTSKWHEYISEYEFSYYFETDAKNSKGTGEEDYIDNVLNVNDIYQANVTITSEKEENKEEKYKVEYVAEEGGSIDRETSEIVNSGEKISNVPTAKADDGYKFVRWELEENGERIEVNPSEYVIKKDTVFYAIFEKIEVVDTSDINIYIYGGIFIIAVVCIVALTYYMKKSKISKN